MDDWENRMQKPSFPSDDTEFPFDTRIKRAAKNSTSTLLSALEPPFKTVSDIYYPDKKAGQHPFSGNSLPDRVSNHNPASAPRYFNSEEPWQLYTEGDAEFAHKFLQVELNGFETCRASTNDLENNHKRPSIEKSVFKRVQLDGRDLDDYLSDNKLKAKSHISLFETEITKWSGCAYSLGEDPRGHLLCTEKLSNSSKFSDDEREWNAFNSRTNCLLDSGRLFPMLSNFDLNKGNYTTAIALRPANDQYARTQKEWIYEENFDRMYNSHRVFKSTPPTKLMFGVMESDSSVQSAMNLDRMRQAERKTQPFLQFSDVYTDQLAPLGPPLANRTQNYNFGLWLQRMQEQDLWPTGRSACILPIWSPGKLIVFYETRPAYIIPYFNNFSQNMTRTD